MNNSTGRFNDLPLMDKAMILYEKSHCIFHVDGAFGCIHHIHSMNRYFVVMTTTPDHTIAGIDMIHDFNLPIIDMICDNIMLTRQFKDNLPVGILVKD
jgi:hypothetical protein